MLQMRTKGGHLPVDIKLKGMARVKYEKPSTSRGKTKLRFASKIHRGRGKTADSRLARGKEELTKEKMGSKKEEEGQKRTL